MSFKIIETSSDGEQTEVPLTKTLANQINSLLGSQKRASWVERLWWKIETPTLVILVFSGIIVAVCGGVGLLVFCVRFAWRIAGGEP